MKFNSRVVAGVAATALLFTAACGNSPENAETAAITALSVLAPANGAVVQGVPVPPTTVAVQQTTQPPEARLETQHQVVVPVAVTGAASDWVRPDVSGLTDMEKAELAWDGVANEIFRKADAPMRQDVLQFYLSDPYRSDAVFFYNDLSQYEVEVDYKYRFDRVESESADLIEFRVCVWSQSVTTHGDIIIDAGNPEPLFNLARFEPQGSGRWTMFWYGGWSPRQVDVELGVDHYRRCEL